MPNLTIVGTQWGDEGKGKVVDYLARTADLVARYQGGPNAGHTVCVSGREIVLHQIPCGILRPNTKCVIGYGCVVDPSVVDREVSELRRFGVRIGRRLLLDSRAQMILPYHRQLDVLRDAARRHVRIGTTGRGIGPAYQDRIARIGVRAADLLDRGTFDASLSTSLRFASGLLRNFGVSAPRRRRLSEEYWQATRRIARLVGDGSAAIERMLRANGRVLFEGAQGTHLDIDLGTYPYVTSSTTWLGGVAPGTGVSPLWLQEAVGVTKAYLTRVGEGPFPTEMASEDAGKLRGLGAEFGATTGRPRRCGWFDAGMVRASIRHNRLSALVLTKLDVLDSLSEIRFAVAYRRNGRRVSEFDPDSADPLEPVYRTLPGWREPTRQCRQYRELPLPARRYVSMVAEQVGCPVALVSVGSERAQMVEVEARSLEWLRSS